MIELPLAFQSGNTLLAELDPDHYITDKKRVVAKLTADNLWVKPVVPIVPSEVVSIANAEHKRLLKPYLWMQEYEKSRVFKHLPGQHDQYRHAGKRQIPSGFDNWYPELDRLLETAENNIDSIRGNPLLNVITENAGFNEKPTIVGQAEFDAIEGTTLYRGVTSEAFVDDFKESIVQYGGEGTFGNGTYFTDTKATTELYANTDSQNNVIEMKLAPDANVLTFNDTNDLRFYARQQSDTFLDGYKKTGANPSQIQQVQWQLDNDADWTNIAIMRGIDAIEIRNPTTVDDAYVIVLNRGKVIINDKP